MRCVRCKHPLPPRADRCLRCFALNPQNLETPLPPAETVPEGEPVPRSGAKAAPTSGQRPAIGAGRLPGAAPRAGKGAPVPPHLSIDSDAPAPQPLSLSFESDPPAPVRLDFSSDPAPAADFGLGEPQALGLDQLGNVIPAALRSPPSREPRALGSRPRLPAPGASPSFQPQPAPPQAATEELAAAELSTEEIEAMLAAKKERPKRARMARPPPAIDPSEQPTEPPTAPPPPAPTEESEVDRLRAALDDAALDPGWGRAQRAPAGAGPFNSPSPPLQASAQEERSGIVAGEGAPLREPEAEEERSGIGAPDDVPVAPPVSLPSKPALALTPVEPEPDPEPLVLPALPSLPPPARTTPRARLVAWTFDASVLFTAGAGFVALTAAVLGRPQLAPLGYQSPDSWADQLLFGRNLPLLWSLLLLTLGVAYSWLFAALGGRTPGMQLAGLRLRKLDGGLPGPALGLAHALLALPSLLGLFGFLSALFDPKCQTVHDKLLGLVVEPDE